MRLNTRMPTRLRPYFKAEINAYYEALKEVKLKQAWHHLERAHVIGQAYPWEHSYAHWKMLLFGIRIKNTKEVLGQLPRLLVGGVKSFVGKVPVGNTGGANIPPLKRLPIDAEIEALFEKAGVQPFQ